MLSEVKNPGFWSSMQWCWICTLQGCRENRPSFCYKGWKPGVLTYWWLGFLIKFYAVNIWVGFNILAPVLNAPIEACWGHSPINYLTVALPEAGSSPLLRLKRTTGEEPKLDVLLTAGHTPHLCSQYNCSTLVYLRQRGTCSWVGAAIGLFSLPPLGKNWEEGGKRQAWPHAQQRAPKWVTLQGQEELREARPQGIRYGTSRQAVHTLGGP